MNIKRIVLDLAKYVFQLHGVDSHEQPVLRKKLKREHILPYFRDLPACLIGMEACSSTNYWARELQKLGHTVKLMAPQFADSDPGAKRLQQIPGIGPVTATALISGVGDASQFKRGRDMAAWLGLTPGQHSSGGKEHLLSISKHGDA